jgi:hypothetical protein
MPHPARWAGPSAVTMCGRATAQNMCFPTDSVSTRNTFRQRGMSRLSSARWRAISMGTAHGLRTAHCGHGMAVWQTMREGRQDGRLDQLVERAAQARAIEESGQAMSSNAGLTPVFWTNQGQSEESTERANAPHNRSMTMDKIRRR